MRYLILFLFISTTVFSQNYHYALDETSRVSTPDETAPLKPKNFEINNITSTTAVLNWTAATDDVGVADYRVYNSDTLLLESTKGSVTYYTLKGLRPSTNYSLTLRAVDAAGNESPDSNNVIFITEKSNTYSLTSTKRVSIGLYDSEDRLLRTLVTNETKTAGTYNPPTWDGKNDDGENVSGQGDHYLIVANAIEAEWEGVIGNSSTELVGANKWKAQNFPKESLIIGNDIYFAYDSNEQDPSVQKASLSDYQKRIPLFYSPRIHPGFSFLAWDGNMLYMGGQSVWDTNGNKKSYVCASTLDNMWQYSNWHTFANGTTTSMYSNTFQVADYFEDLINPPKVCGLAVQTGNDNLFVFRESTNDVISSIHVIHKTTGALRQDITSYNKPKLGKIDSNGYLWFIHGDEGNEVLEKFTINNSTGAITSTGLTLTGLNNVQALCPTPDGNTIAVADMATYDQIKGYSSTTLELQWTLGRAESYSEDATVYNDKFMFDNHGEYNSTGHKYMSISFESDGSMWVIDGGNERVIKFDASRNYVDQIIWKSNFYTTNIDHSNPTRLFAGFMEYEIDYSKPLVAGEIDQAWKLVRHWGKISHLASQGVEYGTIQPLLGVETLSNGRTYGWVVSKGGGRRILEFVSGGAVRNTGVTINYNTRPPSYGKGGVLTTYNGASTWTLSQQVITGFDANHNPIISSPITQTIIASSSNGFFHQPLTTPDKTANNIQILLDSRKGNEGHYHLAGYRLGEALPVFQTTKSVAYGSADPYPLGTNTFDVRTSVKNAASKALAMDDWFIWGYYGEFWQNTQTNYWHMLTEEGLFLYDFGTDGKKLPSWAYSKAGMAGNAFGPSLVKVEGQVYLYHNDESFHGGVHRWKIKNLSSIEKFIIRF